MFRKYAEEYNPKINFKMLYSINPYLKIDEDFVELKSNFKHNTKPLSKQGIMFDKLKKIFNYLKSIEIKNIKEKNIKKIIKKLEITSIDDEKVHSFVCMIRNDNHEDIPYFAVKSFAFITKNGIFDNISSEIGFLFMNAILCQNHYIPMVIFKEHLLFFKSMIMNMVTEESIVEIFSHLQDVSMRYTNKFDKVSKQYIINILNESKHEIINLFRVKKIWLYGSFVKDDATAYSDVDLFVQMDDVSLKCKLEESLSLILKRPVDIQIEGQYNPLFTMHPALEERELVLDAC